MPNTGYAIAVKLWVVSQSQRRMLEFLRLTELPDLGRLRFARIWLCFAAFTLNNMKIHSQCSVCYVPRALHNFFEEG